MDYHRQFRQAAIAQGIPADEIDTFAGFLRFAIWTRTHGEGTPVGQRGGLPRLPAGTAWPLSEDGEPLPFVASFDCAALPRVDDLPLPTDGTLLFFLHHEDAHETYDVTAEQGHARVLHVPAGVETVTAEVPEYSDMTFSNMELEFVTRAYDLYASVTADLPDWLDESGPEQHLGRHLTHLPQLRALAGKLWPENGTPEVMLGGHSMHIGELATDAIHTTPETRIADERLSAAAPDGWAAGLEEETLRVMSEWVPLAQFVPEDVYIGRFLIRRDDLAAGRYDRAMSYTAFTE
ncbi:YwqG family protein [Catenuloplanes japonicus]|uniref:YwqG family protein n=1 Tax=Catenuloplanes japonicus TaxID=33876 RepID=UPI0005266950|nr:YwqG family protein [Catenuloplanes japonicus]